MPKQKQLSNPFYVLLVVVGILFVVTSCGYSVMAVRGINPAPQEAEASAAGQGLMAFLDEHGVVVLVIELVVLGVATLAAIATDQYWIIPRTESGKEEPK